MKSEIYLDHAATSFPKPPVVVKAVVKWAEQMGASAGRGDYPRAVRTGEMISSCRRELAQLLGLADPDRVIFTLNCTDAINLALRGLSLKKGDRVVVGPTEHNSVMRPLRLLQRTIGIDVVCLRASGEGSIDPADLAKALSRKTRLVAIQHASNVLGAIHDLAALGRIARARGATFLVDAAQTAGACPIDMARMRIDLLAVPGHKALQGPLGTGALLVDSRIPLEAWRVGGTGSRSEDEEHPEHYPDRLEAGSHNAPGIAGLLASLQWIRKRGVKNIRAHEETLLRRFLEGLDDFERDGRLRILGPRDARRRSPVVTIAPSRRDPRLLASLLWKRHRIMVRPGLHCAPAAHRLGKTYPDGALRFSFGPFTSTAQIDAALSALGRMLSR
ncbi:MAG: aminotransferase class V-fold PLP-dependent enzyme [Candidatus Hydrogenedentota bacterium]